MFLTISCTDNFDIPTQDKLYLGIYDFKKEFPLWRKVNNHSEIEFILEELKNLKKIPFVFETRLTLWKISVLDKDENLIIEASLCKDGDLQCFISKNQKFYKNDTLFQYLQNLTKLDKIQSYPRHFNQQQYNEMLKEKD